MELVDYVAELGGEYARLLLFVDTAERVAKELGETKMQKTLHAITHEVSARLVELANEVSARTV